MESRRTQVIVLSTLALLIACDALSPAFAQVKQGRTFYNLGLEQYTPEGYPLGWYIEAEAAVGAEAGRVTIRSDTIGPREAMRSLRIETKSEGPVVIYTPLLPGAKCFTAVAVRAAVRSEGAANVRLFFLLPGSGRPDAGQAATNTDGWQQVEHRIHPGECLRKDVVVGALVTGFGTVWLDDVALEINGTAHVDEPPAKPSSDVDNIDRLVLSIVSVDPGANRSDLIAFKPLSSRSGIVALGENSHGARELFLLKHRLVRYFIEELGFTTFALEMPATEADQIDAYVSGKSDDGPATLKALTYPSWQTREMWDLVEWLRSHNRTAQTPVSFRGFDVNQPQLALNALRRQASAMNDTTALRLAASIADATKAGNAGIGRSIALVDSLDRYARENKPTLSRYTRILSRGLRQNRPDQGGNSRDAYMADELLDVLRSSRGPVVAWADNSHVTQHGGAMGSYLSEELGAAYVAVGFSFDHGNYSAYGPHNPYKVHPPYPGTHEYSLSKLQPPTFLLDLRQVPMTHSLHDLGGFRYLGSRPQQFTQFFPQRLSDHFDIIGFTRRVTATTFLVAHQF